MAHLEFNESHLLETFLQMEGGFVLDFSNKSFGDFVQSYTGRDILSGRYAGNGDSKARRLRQFLKLEQPDTVAKLIRALIEYRDLNKSHEPDVNARQAVIAIAERLEKRKAKPRSRPIDIPKGPEGIPDAYFVTLWKHGFELVEIIGQGLSGHVYKARQRSLGRYVAVKFFDNKFSVDNEGLRARFKKEAAHLARIENPSLPYVITQGEVQPADRHPIPYYVMQFIDGRSLEVVLEAKLPDTTISFSWFRNILGVLAAAHAVSLVHRDVAPANVLVGSDGRCWLIDFSIGVDISTRESHRVTKTGDKLGRAGRVPPEVLRDGAKACTFASDVWCAGALLFEMLTGHLHATSSPISTQLPIDLPGLAALLEKACHSLPEHRFRDAREFLDTFETLIPNGHPKNMARPAPAICTYPLCDKADWSETYYFGPRFIESNSDVFCDACGHALLRACPGCDGEVTRGPFCAKCGAQFYERLRCEKCDAPLHRSEIQAVDRQGCYECRPRRSPSATTPLDDLPF